MNKSNRINRYAANISVIIWVLMFVFHLALMFVTGIQFPVRVFTMALMIGVSFIIRIKYYDSSSKVRAVFYSALAGDLIYILMFNHMFVEYSPLYMECSMPFQFDAASTCLASRKVHTEWFPEYIPENVSDFSLLYDYGFLDNPEEISLSFTADDEWIKSVEEIAEKECLYSYDIKELNDIRNGIMEEDPEKSTNVTKDIYYRRIQYYEEGKVYYMPLDYEDLTYKNQDMQFIFINRENNFVKFVAVS